MTSVWPALAPLARAPQTTRLLRANDVGDTGFYGARVFMKRGLVVVQGRESAYFPRTDPFFRDGLRNVTVRGMSRTWFSGVDDPEASRITDRVESRPVVLFARSTGEAAHTFRRLPPGAKIENGILRIGARAFSGWTKLDRGAALGFFAGDHYVFRDPYPLSFRPLAQIRDTLEWPQLNELTEDQVKDLQARGILGQDIPRGHSVLRIVSPMHEIHDSLFPKVVVTSVVCDEIEGTITVNYKLELAGPDGPGSYKSPAAYVAVDTTRVGPRGRFKFVRNLISEGA